MQQVAATALKAHPDTVAGVGHVHDADLTATKLLSAAIEACGEEDGDTVERLQARADLPGLIQAAEQTLAQIEGAGDAEQNAKLDEKLTRFRKVLHVVRILQRALDAM